VTTEQRQAFEQISEALYDGSGPLGLAIGARDGAPFLAYFGHSESELDVETAARTALGSAWLARPLGLLTRCVDDAPGVVTEDGALRLQACDGAAGRELVLTRSQAARALVLSPTSRGGPAEAVAAANAMTRAYAAEARVAELDPASQRLLSALPEQSVLAALVDVVRLMPSLAGMMRSRTPPVDGAAAPIALAASVESDALSVKLILAPGAATQLANLALSLSR
jgi:hypothetical protein